MILKKLCTILALVVSALNAFANAEFTGPQMFSPGYYINLYPDLKEEFGNREDWVIQVSKHYREIGVKEGRSPNPFFVPDFYLERYPDLKKTLGATNYAGALHHWITAGVHEGRAGSALFDPLAYKSRNRDLNKTFRQRYAVLGQHFLQKGLSQGRDGKPEPGANPPKAGAFQINFLAVTNTGSGLDLEILTKAQEKRVLAVELYSPKTVPLSKIIFFPSASDKEALQDLEEDRKKTRKQKVESGEWASLDLDKQNELLNGKPSKP